MSSSKLRRACLHEAGHALVALKLGVRLKSVRANADGSGSAIPENADAEDQRQILRVAYAGTSGEKLEFSDARWHVDTNDGVIAHKALLNLGNYQRESDAASEDVEKSLRELPQQLQEIARFLGDRANRPVPWPDIEDLWEAIKP